MCVGESEKQNKSEIICEGENIHVHGPLQQTDF